VGAAAAVSSERFWFWLNWWWWWWRRGKISWIAVRGVWTGEDEEKK
jgi:hypothetical protein